jgi:hypothetical protein
MIAEDLLERGLANAAEEYDVPDAGLEQLRELLAPRVVEDEDRRRPLQAVRTWRPSRRNGLLAFAAAIIALIAVPIAIGGGGNNDGNLGSGGVAVSSPRVDGAGVGTAPGAVSGGSSGTLYGTAHRAARSTQSLDQQSAAVPAPAPSGTNGRFAGGGFSESSGAGGAPTNADSSKSVLSPIPPISGDQARVVKTGELDLQVTKGQVTTTISRLTSLAQLMHGYVSDSHTTEGNIAPSGDVTMRVPVNAFEQTVTRARGYGKVLSLETSGVDVTAKYVDLKARIRALSATRRTFLSILSRATSIGATLAVQDRITAVQTQIEQLQGQVKVLRNQSQLSTLTVTVDQPTVLAKPAQRHHDNGFVKAVKLSVSRFVRGVEAIVGVIGPILLAVILVLLAWLGAKFGYRTVQRRMV